MCNSQVFRSVRSLTCDVRATLSLLPARSRQPHGNAACSVIFISASAQCTTLAPERPDATNVSTATNGTSSTCGGTRSAISLLIVSWWRSSRFRSGRTIQLRRGDYRRILLVVGPALSPMRALTLLKAATMGRLLFAEFSVRAIYDASPVLTDCLQSSRLILLAAACIIYTLNLHRLRRYVRLLHYLV